MVYWNLPYFSSRYALYSTLLILSMFVSPESHAIQTMYYCFLQAQIATDWDVDILKTIEFAWMIKRDSAKITNHSQHLEWIVNLDGWIKFLGRFEFVSRRSIIFINARKKLILSQPIFHIELERMVSMSFDCLTDVGIYYTFSLCPSPFTIRLTMIARDGKRKW